MLQENANQFITKISYDIPGFACFTSPNFSTENSMYGVLARSIGLGAVDADKN